MKEGKSFYQGMQAAIPTALGYISIGLACGIMAAPYMNPLEMLLMSVLVYAGSAQFAMIGLFAIQANIVEIAMTVFLINLRMGLMSLHASNSFRKDSLLHNIGIGTLLTDETYGVLLGEQVHEDSISARWMHGNNVTAYLAWMFGTVTGTALGSMLPNPELFGLDFALVGMFVGIFASQCQAILRKIAQKKLLLIIAVVTVSYLGLSMLVSKSLAVLFATLLACTVGVLTDD